ncbi:MAG: methylmalonyl-CoA mutase [Proteobacteria bacterium]|nr:methylmalonyl-CoA mutase [Pseudomonadota bacterium]
MSTSPQEQPLRFPADQPAVGAGTAASSAGTAASSAGTALSNWRAMVEKDLKGVSFDKRLVSTTEDGLRIEPLYTPNQGANQSAEQSAEQSTEHTPSSTSAGWPGLPPFARGGAPLPTPGGWDVRVRIATADPALAARTVADELGHGAHSLWITFDRSLRLGADPDAAAYSASPATPVDGVVAAHVDALDALLAGVDLARVAIDLDAGSSALAAAAALVALARRRGLAPTVLHGSCGADPLGLLAAEGRLPCAIERLLQQLADLAGWTTAHAPQWRAVTVSTLAYHEAGATAAQELGLALATGAAYLRRLTDAGLPLDPAALQLTFRLAVGRDVFLELAKLRAARLTWARLVAAAGGGAAAQRMRVHASTAWRTKTARDPWVNLLRTTVEGFAAAAAGADALTTLPFDEALGPSDDAARRLARNTQTILRDEADLGRVLDPAGGSWYVEAATRGLAEAAWGVFQQVEAEGGLARALLSGAVGRWIGEASRRRHEAIVKRRQPLTGVSEFADVHEQAVVRPAPAAATLRAGAAAALSAHRAAHPQSAAVAGLVARLAADAPAEPGALMAAAIEGAAASATLGQLAALLQAGAGARPALPEPLAPGRDAAPFERLRDASEAYAAIHGRLPRVFLANLGPIPQHRARAEFAANLLQAGGFEPLGNDGFAQVDDAVAAFAASGAEGAAICSTDEAYAEFAEPLARSLRERGARFVILAGRPGEREPAYRAAGIDHFIALGGDAEHALTALLKQLGVPL